MLLTIYGIVLWIFCAIATGAAAKSKGQGAFEWYLAGFLFGIFALLAIMAFADKSETEDEKARREEAEKARRKKEIASREALIAQREAEKTRKEEAEKAAREADPNYQKNLAASKAWEEKQKKLEGNA